MILLIEAPDLFLDGRAHTRQVLPLALASINKVAANINWIGP